MKELETSILMEWKYIIQNVVHNKLILRGVVCIFVAAKFDDYIVFGWDIECSYLFGYLACLSVES